ncbi:MAG: DEAD/DEAH box helicase [Planctomycetota bacterium]
MFKSLFRGRDDVYARRFESRRTGKSGYVPACVNEWVTGICEKPRVKCADCSHRRFLPVTNETITNHLRGIDDDGNDFIMGIYPMLPNVESVLTLSGGMNKKSTISVLDRLQAMGDCEPFVLLATGKYVGEGFDCPRLDTLFITLPISWRGTVAQYVGRLHRLHDDKKEVRVYDYADLNVPMLSRMFDRRCKGYEAIGYKILLPLLAFE